LIIIFFYMFAKEVYNKARLMSMFPNDPQVRGSYYKSYKV